MVRRPKGIVRAAGIILAAHVLSNGSFVVLGIVVALILHRRLREGRSRAHASAILAIWITLLPAAVAALPVQAAPLTTGATHAAPNANFVIAIDGIDSSSHLNDDGSMTGNGLYTGQLQALGYNEARVFYFSYRGTTSSATGAWSFHAPYARSDTYNSIKTSAGRLADLVALVHAREPRRDIDLVAHSIGGLVARYYLTYLYRPAACGAARIERLVTFATPHRGAPLASLVGSLESHGRLGRAALAVLATVTRVTRLSADPRAESVREMAPSSSLMRSLVADWDPSIVAATSIAIDNDMFVSPSRAALRGARSYTVPGPSVLSFLLHPRDPRLVGAHGAIVTDHRAWAAAEQSLYLTSTTHDRKGCDR